MKHSRVLAKLGFRAGQVVQIGVGYNLLALQFCDTTYRSSTWEGMVTDVMSYLHSLSTYP